MKGRKSLDLQEILKRIPGIGCIQRVCMDMCASFADAVRKALPGVEIVIDRFHIIKLLNKKLDKLRIKTYSKLEEPKRKEFSHIRYLLSKDKRALLKDERRLVKKYLRLNLEMKDIYWLCQDFRRILFPKETPTALEASGQLTDWCTKARKHLGKFVKTLDTWWKEVVNACVSPLNNGRAEGFNNKIKLVKRQGFGFRNRLNFKLRIQAACNP